MENTNPTIANIAVFDKAALFAALKPKFKIINIDGFGDIRIKEITAGESANANKRAKESGEEFWTHLLVTCATDLQGNKIFTEEDIPAILESGNAGVDAMVGAALVVNGFKKDTAEKNLPTTTADASSSA